MTDSGSQRRQIAGRGIPVRGDDIDTDRIIPARYLRTVTFDDLGDHAFEDDRAASGGAHPFDAEQYEGAAILLGNKNFGCGSSREHAPQALMRWGIRAFLAESYAEIFFGNCVSLGLPCLRVSEEDAGTLIAAVEADPTVELHIDIAEQQVRAGELSVAAQIAEGPRDQFVSGTWDVVGQLVEARDQIEATAARLPYVTGFQV